MKQNHLNMHQLLGIESWSQGLTDYGKTGCHANYFVTADKLLFSVNLIKENGFVLDDITGVDTREGIMLIYHFDRFERSERISLRTMADHILKQVPSIVPIYSGADWHERECFDFFGVKFENHPNLKPLLLPDDLNIHPLLKGKNRKSLYTLIDFKLLTDNEI